MGLEYDYPKREKACATKPLGVKLNGRSVGEIRKVKDGYQYYPNGQNKGEDILATVSAVQNSLLSIQPTKESKKQHVETDDCDLLNEDLRKARKKIDRLEVCVGRAGTLLAATVDLLHKQVNSEAAVNLLEENVNYDDIDCDGHSLVEDITKYLE